MKSYFQKLFVILTVLFQCEFAFATENSFPDIYEWALFDEINHARTQPAEVASALGLDVEKILKDFPEYVEIFENGLPPLQFNIRLYNAAKAHNSSMYANQFYSSVSPDGGTVLSRMIEAGYLPCVWGETLGMLIFANFLPESYAVDIMFENMFKDELDSSYSGERNILNPAFSDIGVAIDSGTWSFLSGTFNSYVVTSDFASSSDNPIESELIAFINQLRSNPRRFLSLLPNIDLVKVYDRFSSDQLDSMALSPLISDSRVHSCAKERAYAKIEQNFFPVLEQRTEQEIDECRYDNSCDLVQNGGDLFGAIQTAVSVDQRKAARSILIHKIVSAFNNGVLERNGFLYPDYKWIGAFLEDMEYANDDGSNLFFNFLSIITTSEINEFSENEKPSEDSTSQVFLYCVVFSDANGNGIYDMGEGMGDAQLNISDGDLNVCAMTDRAGSATVPLTKGTYEVAVSVDGEIQIKSIEIDEKNIALWFNIVVDGD